MSTTSSEIIASLKSPMLSTRTMEVPDQEDDMFLAKIQLKRINSFVHVDASASKALDEASSLAVNYLNRLVQGLYGQH